MQDVIGESGESGKKQTFTTTEDLLEELIARQQRVGNDTQLDLSIELWSMVISHKSGAIANLDEKLRAFQQLRERDGYIAGLLNLNERLIPGRILQDIEALKACTPMTVHPAKPASPERWGYPDSDFVEVDLNTPIGKQSHLGKQSHRHPSTHSAVSKKLSVRAGPGRSADTDLRGVVTVSGSESFSAPKNIPVDSDKSEQDEDTSDQQSCCERRCSIQ